MAVYGFDLCYDVFRDSPSRSHGLLLLGLMDLPRALPTSILQVGLTDANRASSHQRLRCWVRPESCTGFAKLSRYLSGNHHGRKPGVFWVLLRHCREVRLRQPLLNSVLPPMPPLPRRLAGR